MRTESLQTAGAPRRDALGRLRGAGELLPGLALAGAVAVAGWWLAGIAGAAVLRLQGLDPAGRGSPVSAISLSVILGLLVANTVGVHRRFAPGLDVAMKKLLRVGIVLVGLKLSLVDVLEVGLVGVPVVFGLVAVALGVTLLLARAAKVGPNVGLLAAASTAICGITATLAVAPAIEADDEEVAYTVANVTLFGLVAMLAYPYLAHALFADAPGAAGLFLGTAIHDTSQVMGAALSYREVFGEERVAHVAAVAKLTRNALLVAVVPLLALLAARRTGGTRAKVRLAGLFPLFVLGFVALSAVRTIGDVSLAGGGAAFGLLDEATFRRAVKALGDGTSTWLLAIALAGVGLSTRFSVLRRLGVRPLLVGLAAALTVGGAALALAALVGPHLG